MNEFWIFMGSLQRVSSVLRSCQTLLLLSLANIACAGQWFSQPEVQLISEIEGKQNQRLILGDVKKANTVWISEVDLHLFAPYKDWLFQFPRGSELSPILQSWLTDREVQAGKVIHQCEGRQCGSSSFYANLVFNVRTLYGRDDNQAYVAWLNADHSALVSFYAVVRGNRTVQVLIRETQLSEINRKALFRKLGEPLSTSKQPLSAQFQLTLDKNLSIDWVASEAELKKLVQWLESQSEMPAYLVLYRYMDGPLVETQKLTQSYLTILVEHLSQSGVSVKLLEPVGAGAIRVTPAPANNA
jgi:hypothetical protein